MARAYRNPSAPEAEWSDTDVLAKAHYLVDTFLAFLRLERPQNDILDTDCLPASKPSLISAFRLVIATEPRGEVREALSCAGHVLAQFQNRVGPRICVTPARPTRTHERSAAEGGALERVLRQVDEDTRRLRALLGKASSIAESRFQRRYARPPFQDDGTYTWYGHC
ncbi:hypothetical protein JQ506_25550 (plasmid) [Shinella sp. PSBB067]|uniref:hypothetical protein n=1 Tax=Shinella sp. PSBB067 TaxID=2715959 RepID=UPI00092BA004|nr:hypothetical protein [Shinella sp. PSBB067]OJU84926.1 MAG: hypothetical protein BGO06_10245 [Shinella sp. 65-6]QRI66150.1 hypothetical protein JQ506_25550 [Shinella sp. PSBB067]